MFYRRKILLALLEAFGGFLTKTDCQKLLFLYCCRREKNYYDFFPHKYGNYSLILTQDKDRLTNLDFLIPHNDFQLNNRQQSYLSQLNPKDLAILHTFVSEIGGLRGEGLIHKTYVEMPQYVSRSQIATQLLTETEYEHVSRTWNNDKMPCLFTIGYEGLSIDAYLNLLISNNVAILVDVRKNPVSMKYGFSKKKLMAYTELAGKNYIHIPDLGVPSELRQDLHNPAAYQKLFDFYYSHILPHHVDTLEQLKKIVSTNGRTAITCFEADHHFCHRHKVTEYLQNDPTFNTKILHLHKNGSCFPDTHSRNGLLEENAIYSSI